MLRPVWQGLGYDEKVGQNYRLRFLPRYWRLNLYNFSRERRHENYNWSLKICVKDIGCDIYGHMDTLLRLREMLQANI